MTKRNKQNCHIRHCQLVSKCSSRNKWPKMKANQITVSGRTSLSFKAAIIIGLPQTVFDIMVSLLSESDTLHTERLSKMCCLQ
jgi:hypothetical protein